MKGEAYDRSQWGNKSCFRNETINKGSFKWSPAFVLPANGNFEFDFVYMPPSRGLKESDQMDEDQFSLFKDWFVTKAQSLIDQQEKEREFVPNEGDQIRKMK